MTAAPETASPARPAAYGRRGARVTPGGPDAPAPMTPPLAVITVAVVAAAVVAYGTDPRWAAAGSIGLDVILLARRLQWPLGVASLLLCVALIGLVISGRRRAWWLIGLGPVLALFVHGFVNNPLKPMLVLDRPEFVDADGAAAFMRDGDPVVGLIFNGTAYAYPNAALARAPVVVQAEHDQRMVLMWSAASERAVAAMADRQLKARDVELVSAPAGALLLYDTRLGQFINALTGQTPDGKRPAGLGATIETRKMTWKQWRALNADTRVMVPPAGDGAARAIAAFIPARARSGDIAGLPAEARVSLVGIGGKFVAIRAEQVGAVPVNLRAGKTGLLVFRDPRSGVIRAFDRRVEDDLVPMFRPTRDAKNPAAAFVDNDTGTGWSLDGVAVTGRKEYRGRRLAPAVVEDDLPWGVMKFWYPELELVPVTPAAPAPLAGTGR